MRTTACARVVTISVGLVCCGATASTYQFKELPLRIILIADPTISAREWLPEGLVGSLATHVREGSQVVTIIVNSGLIARTSPSIYDFPVNKQAATDAGHKDSVLKSFRKIADEYSVAWDAVHHNTNSSEARTCLLTALYQAGRVIEEQNQAKPRRTEIIIASDFLEACNDSRTAINLEKRLLQTESLWPLGGGPPFQLKGVAHVHAVRASSIYVDKPAALDHLQRLWSKSIEALGVSPAAFHFGDTFSAVVLNRPN